MSWKIKTRARNLFNTILSLPANKTAPKRAPLFSKYIRNSAARGIDSGAVRELEAALLHTDCIAALYYPTSADDQKISVQDQPERGRLPVPPQQFWHWYAQNEQFYLRDGRGLAQIFRESARKHGIAFAPGQRILDFGCSGGRVLRWFEEEAYQGVECWGCDIDAAAINWSQKNLMPPFKFFTNSTAPHLPFKDNSFDLIFAGSVFTHIKDMATIWLLELARCIGKDGVGIFTITDENSLEALYKLARDRGPLAPDGAKYVVENNITPQTLQKQGFLCRDSSPWWLGTLYSRDFFIRRLTLAYDLLEVKNNMKGYQSGYIVRPR